MTSYIIIISDQTGVEKDKPSVDENNEIEVFYVKQKAFKKAHLLRLQIVSTMDVSVYKLTKLNNPNED
jgi:hypothetical protein